MNNKIPKYADGKWATDNEGCFIYGPDGSPILEIRGWGGLKGSDTRKIEQQIELAKYITNLHNNSMEGSK